MNSGLLKKLVPHLIAVVIFLLITVIFCKPVLQGNVLNQSDIIGWKGMSQNAFEYKEKYGNFPLWNPNLFSGMPNYQVAMEGKSILPDIIKIMSLGLPHPMNFFFFACVCFYILCLAFRLNTVVSIFGSLAFAFSTYNPIIVGVGHESKMLAIACMPLLLAGMIFTYERKYWLGLAVATLGAYLEIAVNHPQINFYFLLIALAVTIGYLIAWIKNKDWKHALISGGVVIGAAVVGVAASALMLMTSYEYSKATMRGGKNIAIEGDKVQTAKSSGLDTSYAFQYSFGRAEPVVLLMPEAFGGSSSQPLGEDSKVVEKLMDKGVDQAQATQVAMGLPKYWGGIDGVGTAGPPYVGAIVCILALIGFILYKHPLRWALLAVSILAILMAWGKYLPGFNSFLFNNVPLLNKFRAPSMTMVITELTIPVMAVLSLQYLLFRENSREQLKTDFKKILYGIGGLFGLLFLMYITMDYSSWTDSLVAGRLGFTEANRNDEILSAIISGMKADRKSMFLGQTFRALAFAALVVGLLYLYMKNTFKPIVVTVALALISTIELLAVGNEYLSEEHYVPKDEFATQSFSPTPVDQQILQDKDPNFRVFNAASNTYNEASTSYFHKSIGGYHPAKLRIYQDVIDRYLSGQINENVLNMLNAKYIIANNPQTNQQQLIPNPNAYGNCWLVKTVKMVAGPVEEIQAIGTTNLKDTAIVQQEFSSAVVQPRWDSAAIIRLTRFDPDTLEYAFNSASPQFAVISEVYYPLGWNAYIDGKKVPYCKTNYVLRGLSIPAGQHIVKFIFEPESFKNGLRIAYAASFFILLFLLGGLFMHWKTTRKAN